MQTKTRCQHSCHRKREVAQREREGRVVGHEGESPFKWLLMLAKDFSLKFSLPSPNSFPRATEFCIVSEKM